MHPGALQSYTIASKRVRTVGAKFKGWYGHMAPRTLINAPGTNLGVANASCRSPNKCCATLQRNDYMDVSSLI